jgi:N-formylglutamate amidohydrolase
MRSKAILHIPHSAPHIPSLEGFIVSQEVIDAEILKLTDWYTDDLFSNDDDEMIIAPFSRIFCDTERYEDFTDANMAHNGMGVLYEKNDKGERIRTITPSLKEKIISSYYAPHHLKLSNAVKTHLSVFGKVLIIGGHSFPSITLNRDRNQNENRPDFNIGTDPYHTPQSFIDVSKHFFGKRGYSLGINSPNSGTMVPVEHYQTNAHVSSIMLEINRALYLNEPTNQMSMRYEEIKTVVRDYIQLMKNHFFGYVEGIRYWD